MVGSELLTFDETETLGDVYTTTDEDDTIPPALDDNIGLED